MTIRSLGRDLLLLWLGKILIDIVVGVWIMDKSFHTSFVNDLDITIGLTLGWFIRYLWLRKLRSKERTREQPM